MTVICKGIIAKADYDIRLRLSIHLFQAWFSWISLLVCGGIMGTTV